MIKLKVDLEDVTLAMEMNDDFGSTVLFDTETGEIVHIPSEVMNAVESDDEGKLKNLPEWENELIETAECVLSDKSGRYEDLPRKPSYEAYDLMVEFADTIEDKHLKEKIDIALVEKGAFRRFKNVIRNYPQEEKRWFSLKDNKMKEEIIDWLNAIGIEPVKE